MYYGIAVHHSAERTCVDNEALITKIPIPLKDGSASHYQINWNLIGNNYQTLDNTKQCLLWLDKIEKDVSGRPRIYIQNTRMVLEKIRDEYERIKKTNT